MEKKDFQPYIPADKVVPEMTVVSVLLGCILAVVFGGANAYLGLRVGMTVSASIPAAVISMGIIRKILRRDSILENNMVQTIGSAGESVAAGAIFTLPALFMWAAEGLCDQPSLVEIGLIALCGGVLGVLMMIPLRSALIVKEHGTLAYPEGQACAEVLIAGEEGGAKASTVFSGLGIAALFTGNEYLGTGLSLGVGQHAVLLDDQSAAQGDHHQNAQHTAAQSDETDLHQGGYVAKTILCPHEQGGQSEDGTGGHGLTGRTDGLDHVVLQNGVTAQDLADHSHGDDRGGDRGRHRHTHTQAKVRVCSAEDNGQNSAQDDGDHRELRHDLVCRNIRLEFFLFHDIRSLLSICCAEDAPYSLLRQEHNTQPHHFIKISSVRQGISLFIVGFDE